MPWMGMTKVITDQVEIYEIYQNYQKCEKYTVLWWMFDVQAIYDNINLKY